MKCFVFDEWTRRSLNEIRQQSVCNVASGWPRFACFSFRVEQKWAVQSVPLEFLVDRCIGHGYFVDWLKVPVVCTVIWPEITYLRTSEWRNVAWEYFRDLFLGLELKLLCGVMVHSSVASYAVSLHLSSFWLIIRSLFYFLLIRGCLPEAVRIKKNTHTHKTLWGSLTLIKRHSSTHYTVPWVSLNS